MKETAGGECLCARCERHRRRWEALRRLDSALQWAASRLVAVLVCAVGACAFLGTTFFVVVVMLDGDTPTIWQLAKDAAITLGLWGLGIQAMRGMGDL